MDKDEHGDECDDDADGDGYDKTEDCNDLNPNIKPSAAELCNNLDDDCNKKIDDDAVNCIIFYMDTDSDKYGNPDDFKCLCLPEGKYSSLNPSDCNDSDADINPQKQEKCDDIDNNCNGFTDEAFPAKGSPCDGSDSDFCKEGTWVCNISLNGLVCSDNTDDSTELCNGFDDDCDGIIPADENDDDKDGFRKCQNDCNDKDINIFPGNPYDDCLDGIDNNCDGVDGIDKDHDGYGYGYGCDDCDDENPLIHPDAEDTVGNDIDENCDGIDGVDNDWDGFASVESGGTDCRDDDANINPAAYDWMENQCTLWTNWKIEKIAKTGSVGEYAAMKADNQGKFHVVFYDRSKWSLKYATNISESWQIEIVDSNAGDWGWWSGTSITENGAGEIHIAYIQGDETLSLAEKITNSWQKSTTGKGVSRHPSITADSKGFLHIFHYLMDLQGSTFKLAYSTDRYGTWKTYVIDPEAGDSYSSAGRTAVTADSNDFLHAAYYACGKYNVGMQKCEKGDLQYATNRSGLWKFYTVDSDNNTGWQPSIACDSRNFIHISYYEADNGDLKYAVIDKDYKISVSTVDETANVGKYSSLVLDEYNHSFIAYYDKTMDKVKVAKRLKDQWDMEYVYQIQSLYHMGSFMDIAMGKNRELNVIFWDELNEDLASAKSMCEFAPDTDQNCDGIDGMDLDGDKHPSMDSGGDDCNDSSEYVYGGYILDSVDGIDNDCDGLDGIDADNDGFASEDSGGTDCDDSSSEKNPGMFDMLDGLCEDPFFDFTKVAEGTAPSMAVDKMNRTHMAFLAPSGDNNKELKYGINTSGSWAISTLISSSEISSQLSLAVDSMNNAHVIYGIWDQNLVNLNHAANINGTWTFEIVDSEINGLMDSIYIDKYDYVHISYVNKDSHKLKYATNMYGCWKTSEVVFFPDTDSIYNTSIAVDQNHSVHIATSRENVLYATNKYGYWDVRKIADGNLKGMHALTLDKAGHPYIVFEETADQSSYMKYATDRSGEWKIHTIDTGTFNHYNGECSVMIDAAGAINIAYSLVPDKCSIPSDEMGAQLKFASNKAGIWHSQVINPASGWDSISLAIDSSGTLELIAGNQLGGNDIFQARQKCLKSAGGGDINCDGHDGMDSDGDGEISVESGGADCNDSDKNIHAGADDTAGDGIDSNCDHADGIDADNDGFASKDSGGTDCDDNDINENPLAQDPVGSGNVDENCDGIDGIDNDGDGYASVASGGTDCDDSVKLINPGAADNVGDDIDNNCDGIDGVDNDRDSYASVESGGTDCDDADPFIHPDAEDFAGSGKCTQWGAWAIQALESSEDAGKFNSIARDSNNSLHISYLLDKVSDADLKYTTNASGSWTFYTLDTKDSAGWFSSIAVDADSRVHISYYDKTNSDLKYATNATVPGISSRLILPAMQVYILPSVWIKKGKCI
jgi:hypothetical protein